MLVESVESCVSVIRWRERVAEGTFDRYWYYFRVFLGFLEGRGFLCDPDALVEFQRVNRDYQVLDLLQVFVSGRRMRASTKLFAYSTVRSFFLHNRASLPQDGAFKVRGDAPRVVGSFSVGEVVQVLLASNKCYRALFLCMVQGGLGIGEVLYWSANGFESLVEQLDDNVEFVRVELPGRKRGRNVRPFFSFLGRDAQKALRKWIEERGRGPGEIFVNQFGGPVTQHSIQRYLYHKMIRLGIIKKPDTSGMTSKDYGTIRYGKNPHEFRDFFRTRWQMSEADDPLVAEFMLGHIVDPLGYNKAMKNESYVRGQYRKAEPWLNILSEDPEKVPRERVDHQDRKIEELEELVQHQGRVLAAIQRAQKLGLI